MQEKNILTNTYWSNNERFADMINVGMFQGKKVLVAEELKETDGYCATMIGKSRKKTGIQKQRDVVKKAIFDTNFVIVGIENQSDIHYAMPVRIMGYDFLSYDKQLKEIRDKHRKDNDLCGAEFISGFSKEDKLSPICTLVIYYGKEPWSGPTKLSEILNFENLPDEIRQVVADYPIHIVDVRRFEDSEELETDARLLFGILKREDNVDEMEAYINQNEEAFVNISDDTYDAISILTESNYFLELKAENQNKEGGRNMCEAFRQLEERGEKRGIQIGKRQGEIKLSKLITVLLQENLTRDIALVTSDEDAREQYYIKYGIQ